MIVYHMRNSPGVNELASRLKLIKRGAAILVIQLKFTYAAYAQRLS
jgi:hypothetical protein